MHYSSIIYQWIRLCKVFFTYKTIFPYGHNSRHNLSLIHIYTYINKKRMRCAVKDQLLKGTMILTIAGFATRVIGFCYRIFLAGELGEVNLGIYQLIFPVYSICFTIYAAGIQTAVSQLISHQPQKNHGHIIKAGITLSLCLAVILSFRLFSFRTVIAPSFLGCLLYTSRCV